MPFPKRGFVCGDSTLNLKYVGEIISLFRTNNLPIPLYLCKFSSPNKYIKLRLAIPDHPNRVDSPQIKQLRSLEVQTSLQEKFSCD